MNLTLRLINNCRQYGIWIALRRAFKRTFSPFFYLETHIIARSDIDLSISPPIPRIDPEVLPLIIEEVANLPIPEEKKQLFYERLDDTDNICLSARYDAEIAYYCWISTTRMEIPGIKKKVPLKADEGFLFDAYCFPKFRGQKLHGLMSWKRLEELVRRGKRIAYVSYLKDNRVVENVMRGIGFLPFHEIKCLTIGSRYRRTWHRKITK